MARHGDSERVKIRRSTCYLIIVVAVLVAAWMIYLFPLLIPTSRVSPLPHVREESTPSIRPHSEPAEAIDPVDFSHARVEVATGLLGAKIVVLSSGRPLGGVAAFIDAESQPTLDPKLAVSVSEENGELLLTADQLSQVMSHIALVRSGFIPAVLAPPRPGNTYIVELARGHVLQFYCVDAISGTAIPGVRVAVSSVNVPDTAVSSTMIPGANQRTAMHSSITTQSGYAEIQGLMEQTYVIRAHHDAAILVAGPRRAVVPNSQLVVLQFKRPVVLLLEVQDAQIATNDVAVKGCELSGSSAFDENVVRSRISQRFSDFSKYIVFVGVPADKSIPFAQIAIWTTNGRYFEVKRELRNWSADLQPEIVSLGNQGKQLLVGEAILVCKDPVGNPISLGDVYLRPRTARAPAFPVRMDGEVRLTLPEGEYVLISDQRSMIPFLRDFGIVKVDAGKTTHKDVTVKEWPVRIDWKLSLDDSNPIKYASVEIRNEEGTIVHQSSTEALGGAWLPTSRVYGIRFIVPGYICEGSIRVLDRPQTLEFRLARVR